MIKTDISESTFSRKYSSTHELSILHRMDSFAFMITDEQRRVQVLRDYEFTGAASQVQQRREDLDRLFGSDEWIGLSYRTVRVGLMTELQTLVPNRLFNPHELPAYLDQLASRNDGLDIGSDDLGQLAAQNVYAFPRLLLDLYRRRFPSGRVMHCSSAFLKAYRRLLNGRPGPSPLFVHVWPHLLQLTYFSGPDLQFINTFVYQSAKDFLYFTMLAYDQLALDPTEVPVLLSGQILEDSEIYRMLTRYIRQVEMIKEPGCVQQNGPVFEEMPAHLYFDLFSLAECD